MTFDECRTCKYAFTTGKDRLYCKKSLADKDDCGEYSAMEQEPPKDGKKDVLDKIRDELFELYNDRPSNYNHEQRKEIFIKTIKIIDKYKKKE